MNVGKKVESRVNFQMQTSDANALFFQHFVSKRTMDFFKFKLETTEMEILKMLSESKNWEPKSSDKNLE